MESTSTEMEQDSKKLPAAAWLCTSAFCHLLSEYEKKKERSFSFFFFFWGGEIPPDCVSFFRCLIESMFSPQLKELHLLLRCTTLMLKKKQYIFRFQCIVHWKQALLLQHDIPKLSHKDVYIIDLSQPLILFHHLLLNPGLHPAPCHLSAAPWGLLSCHNRIHQRGGRNWKKKYHSHNHITKLK